MSTLRYTHAIVARVPRSLNGKFEIKVDEARRQHENFVKLLRELGLDVIELPPDEDLPESVFIEDTAVIVNGIVLISKPGNIQRRKEVDTVRAIIKKELRPPQVLDIEDENAKLDGSDVIFTGKELFVGISKWTNEQGAKAVAECFPEYPCTAIKTPDGMHLKSLVTVAGPELLCVSTGKRSQETLRKMKDLATFSYSTLTVPEEEATNVIYVNGTLVHRAENEAPQSFKTICEKLDFPRRSVAMSELCKGGRGISASCLLIRKSKHIRSI